MHNSEFVKKVVPLLEDFEYRQVISKSISRGFIIPGFSNNKRNVKVSIPISLVVSTGVLNKKVNKVKYNYQILLDVMCGIAHEKKESSDILKFVEKWVSNETIHDELEEQLFALEEAAAAENEENFATSNKEKKENIDYTKEIKQLREEIVRLREKNKKNKEDIQSFKIEIDILKQKNFKIEKEKERVTKEYELMKRRYEDKVEGLNSRLNKYDENEKNAQIMIRELKNQVEVLNQYKKTAPKILCITHNKLQYDYPGYDITLLGNMNEFETVYNSCDFNNVWYVRKGFTHVDLIYIKSMIPQEVLILVRDEKELAERINGGRI